MFFESIFMDKTALVVTTINAPNTAIHALAHGAKENNWHFVVIGDRKSPTTFECEGADYYSLQKQLQTNFGYAKACPVGHYARKNIGYLIAITSGAKVIIETDDDNIPRVNFWSARNRVLNTHLCQQQGWINAYRFFSNNQIWPRGLPLDQVNRLLPAYEDLPEIMADCPIQQGLADENPDVDAIYRLLFPLPQSFLTARDVALDKGAWCPFNSQNTTWWSDAFPLLYLPAYCSFRMTDIWRSLVAQRIAWENGWTVRFHEATVWQDRNEHNLMSDFADEVPGYLHNSEIARRLGDLPLRRGKRALADNMIACYSMLVQSKFIDSQELPLLISWLSDIQTP
jgi:hypothetical protein